MYVLNEVYEDIMGVDSMVIGVFRTVGKAQEAMERRLGHVRDDMRLSRLRISFETNYTFDGMAELKAEGDDRHYRWFIFDVDRYFDATESLKA